MIDSWALLMIGQEGVRADLKACFAFVQSEEVAMRRPSFL